jgi:hypothetical protein
MQNPKGIFARYIMRLLPFTIDVIIKPGRVHTNADALSRMPHRNKPRIPYFVERLPSQGQFLPKEE